MGRREGAECGGPGWGVPAPREDALPIPLRPLPTLAAPVVPQDPGSWQRPVQIPSLTASFSHYSTLKSEPGEGNTCSHFLLCSMRVGGPKKATEHGCRLPFAAKGW